MTGGPVCVTLSDPVTTPAGSTSVFRAEEYSRGEAERVAFFDVNLDGVEALEVTTDAVLAVAHLEDD